MAKKSFIKEGDNPALQFLSGTPLNIKKADPEEEPKAAAGGNRKPAAAGKKKSAPKAPEGYKLNPEYVEKRTKRVQLVLQPSLYEALRGYSDKLGLSFNDLAHKAFSALIDHEEVQKLIEGE